MLGRFGRGAVWQLSTLWVFGEAASNVPNQPAGEVVSAIRASNPGRCSSHSTPRLGFGCSLLTLSVTLTARCSKKASTAVGGWCRAQVAVQLSHARLAVSAAGDELLAGRLYAEVKVEDSTWFIGGFTGQCWGRRVF